MIDLSDMKFLIVDDHPALRRVCRKVLMDRGVADVREAEDGAIALRILREESVDLVISDIHMPRMNGLRLLQAIKADERLKHLPVLIATNIAAFDMASRTAFEFGAAGAISKPFTSGELVSEIQRILFVRTEPGESA